MQVLCIVSPVQSVQKKVEKIIDTPLAFWDIGAAHRNNKTVNT